jgi:hypothetical protein
VIIVPATETHKFTNPLRIQGSSSSRTVLCNTVKLLLHLMSTPQQDVYWLNLEILKKNLIKELDYFNLNK